MVKAMSAIRVTAFSLHARLQPMVQKQNQEALNREDVVPSEMGSYISRCSIIMSQASSDASLVHHVAVWSVHSSTHRVHVLVHSLRDALLLADSAGIEGLHC